MLDKAIENGKEFRKPYKGSKAIDPSCRCHGGCPWCLGNRMYKFIKRLNAAENKMYEYEQERQDRKETYAEEEPETG